MATPVLTGVGGRGYVRRRERPPCAHLCGLAGGLAERTLPDACTDGRTRLAGPHLGFGAAAEPWGNVVARVPLKSLAKERRITLTPKPDTFPSDYEPATCDRTPCCEATFDIRRSCLVLTAAEPLSLDWGQRPRLGSAIWPYQGGGTMRIPRKVALVGAAVALLALIPASSASAYSAGEKRAEKRQNARTKKIAKDLTAVKKLVDTVKGSIPSLSEVTAKIDAVDGRLKVIEGAAPQIISGLQKLQTLGMATEYGIGQVFIGGNPEPRALVVTPDVPDAVQQAQATNQFIASQSGALTVQVAVRSAESDGTGSSLPAAHCRVTVQQLGSVATRTSSPNPGLGGAPFWPIDQKSKQTSTAAANAGFPFGPKTSGEDADVLTDLTTGANSTAPAGSPSATAGTPFSVTLACVDTSPSTDDPSA